MRSLLKRIGGLLLGGVLSISTGVIFNVSFLVINIVSWIVFIGISLLLILKLPKRFGLVKKEWFFDDLQTKWKSGGIVMGIILLLLSVGAGILLYRSNIINNYSQNLAFIISKHVRLEQGKPVCISIGEECK